MHRRKRAANEKAANEKKVPTRKSSGKKRITRDEKQTPKHENEMAAGRNMAGKIVDTVRESMLVLDTDLRVVSANASFYRTFQVSRPETEGRLVYELGNSQWDIPELRQLLADVLPDNAAFNDFEVDHCFETIGRKVMRLNGRKIDHIQRILLAKAWHAGNLQGFARGVNRNEWPVSDRI